MWLKFTACANYGFSLSLVFLGRDVSYAQYLRLYIANHTDIPERAGNTTTPTLLITPDTLQDFGDFRLCDEASGDDGWFNIQFVCNPEIIGRYVLIYKYNNSLAAGQLGTLILCEVMVHGHLYSSEFSPNDHSNTLACLGYLKACNNKLTCFISACA